MNIWQVLISLLLIGITTSVVIPRLQAKPVAATKYNLENTLKTTVLPLFNDYSNYNSDFNSFDLKYLVTQKYLKNSDVHRIKNCSGVKSTENGSNLDSNKNCNYYNLENFRFTFVGSSNEIHILVEFKNEEQNLRKLFEEHFSTEKFKTTTGLHYIYRNADFLSDTDKQLTLDLGDETDGKIGFIYKK